MSGSREIENRCTLGGKVSAAVAMAEFAAGRHLSRGGGPARTENRRQGKPGRLCGTEFNSLRVAEDTVLTKVAKRGY